MARVFEEPSRAFLTRAGLPGCGLAVDLGCGPGHTTRLVKQTLRCARVVGLDASDAFVRAAGTSADGVEFLEHDALALPFPVGPADLLYARLLVSHLSEPAEAIRGFASQLRPGGRLLLDEVESIESAAAPFRRYLALVEQVLAERGQCLYVGPRLEDFAAGLRLRASEVRRHPVAAADAATMFSMNLRQLRQDEGVRRRVSEAELDGLAGELEALREGPGPEIVWGLRQLVIEA